MKNSTKVMHTILARLHAEASSQDWITSFFEEEFIGLAVDAGITIEAASDFWSEYGV